MKKRALAALLLCLCFLTLSGCWQEDLSEPESLTPMQSFEEEAEAEEEHAIIPEVFFPSLRSRANSGSHHLYGRYAANHQFPALRGNVPPKPSTGAGSLSL